MNYLWQKFLVELKYHNRIIFDEFSIIYVKVTEYLNSLISVVNLAYENIETGRKDLQMHQTT